MNRLISYNPANGTIIWEGPFSSSAEIQQTVKNASLAFTTWSQTSLEERVLLLENYQQQIKANEDFLAKAISQETGKPLWDSKTEVAAMAAKIPISIEAQKERCSKKQLQLADRMLITEFRPHGTVAVFGPYNFPAHLPNGHIVPALLAGNTVIFKPSELTPFVGELIGKYLKLAGFPEHVFQIVQGGPDAGKALASQDIQGLFFTGSVKTGKLLQRECTNKILALEMGGNNPLVVSSIKDIESAVDITIQSAFITTGQRCSAARRLILTKNGPKKNFLKKLIEKTSELTIGAYDAPEEPFMGPLITKKALGQLLEAQKHLVEKGAKILYPMQSLKAEFPFTTPAILDVTSVSSLPDVEYFGPFLQVIEVDSLEKAIEEANRTSFGLTAGLLSDSPDEWNSFYPKVQAGIINWNTPLTGASSKAPFGGIKESGNFRPSAYLAADYCSYPVSSMQKGIFK